MGKNKTLDASEIARLNQRQDRRCAAATVNQKYGKSDWQDCAGTSRKDIFYLHGLRILSPCNVAMHVIVTG